MPQIVEKKIRIRLNKYLKICQHAEIIYFFMEGEI